MNHTHPSLALLLHDSDLRLDTASQEATERQTSTTAKELSLLAFVILNSFNEHKVGQADISEWTTPDFSIIYESYPSAVPSETYTRSQEMLDANPNQHVVMEDLSIHVDQSKKTATTFVHFEIQGYESGLRKKGLGVLLWRRSQSGMKWKCHQLIHYKGLPDAAQLGWS